jgi:hypothetical protein
MFIAIENVSLDHWLERLLGAQLIANSWVARLAGTSFTFIWTGARPVCQTNRRQCRPSLRLGRAGVSKAADELRVILDR